MENYSITLENFVVSAIFTISDFAHRALFWANSSAPVNPTLSYNQTSVFICPSLYAFTVEPQVSAALSIATEF